MTPIMMTMRHRLRVTLCSSLVVMLGAVNAHAQGPAEDHVGELGVRFWKPSPVLTLSTDTLVGAGVGEVDFVQEFGIEDKYFPEFRVTLGRPHKFRANFVTFDYDAEAIIQRTITFQGRTFNIGARPPPTSSGSCTTSATNGTSFRSTAASSGSSPT